MSDGYVHLKSAKTKKGAEPAEYKEPDYPHGTRLNLSDDHVKALYGDKVPDIGEEHEIHAKGKVTEASDREGEGKRVEIQVTHMKRPPTKERSVRDDVSDAAEKAEAKTLAKKEAVK